MKFEEIENKNREIAKEIMKLVNYMGNDKVLGKALAEELSHEHRTIQQNFFRMIYYTASQYEKEMDGHTDLRNEGALALAKLIVKEVPPLPNV